MVRPDEITAAFNNRWFDSLAGAGDWLITILISLVCLATLYILWNFLEHKKKLIIFPLYGAGELKTGDLKDGNIAEIRKKYPNMQIGVPKIRKGKRVKEKGVRKFQLLKNPFMWKKIPDIDYEYEYPEGIWMIEPTKDCFIPIKRPAVSDTVNIKVPENDMDFWMQLENEALLQRTKDESESKRQMFVTVAIIIGAFVLAGVIIWLSMSFAGQQLGLAYDKAEGVINAVNNVVQTKGPG